MAPCLCSLHHSVVFKLCRTALFPHTAKQGTSGGTGVCHFVNYSQCDNSFSTVSVAEVLHIGKLNAAMSVTVGYKSVASLSLSSQTKAHGSTDGSLALRHQAVVVILLLSRVATKNQHKLKVPSSSFKQKYYFCDL